MNTTSNININITSVTTILNTTIHIDINIIATVLNSTIHITIINILVIRDHHQCSS